MKPTIDLRYVSADITRPVLLGAWRIGSVYRQETRGRHHESLKVEAWCEECDATLEGFATDQDAADALGAHALGCAEMLAAMAKNAPDEVMA